MYRAEWFWWLSYMTDGGVWGTMRQASWIEVRTSRSAAVGVVAELVDVETVLTFSQTGDLTDNGHWAVASLQLNWNNSH